MKLLIANDIDDTLFLRPDPRAWAQRVFWFAEEGDLVLVSDTPDPAFVQHVGSVKGTDMSRVNVRLCPKGLHGRRRIDFLALFDRRFLGSTARELAGVTEVFSLFPSAQLSEFVSQLGIRNCLPGADFIAQGGGELANSKTTFRALAAGSGVRIAAGSVCRSHLGAAAATQWLLDAGHDVMVKMAHHGAGSGNEMVLRPGRHAPHDVGGRTVHELDGRQDAVSRYWSDRWEWASAGGRYAVVVEQLLDATASYYAEYAVTDTGVELGGVGRLSFIDRRLAFETFPARSLTESQHLELVSGAETLARAYHGIGYRGQLCADAVATGDGRIAFTEVNARTTTSTHLYDIMAGLSPAETTMLSQRLTPATWKPISTTDFLATVADAGLLFDRDRRRGVLMTMPVSPASGKGGFLYVIVCGDPDEEAAYQRELEGMFDEA
ncbi:peptide ligase PGM1-related protein [Streptomyces sp. NPDC059909]|uniref:preATP grasp domain-containing protein n=1 Tax=Streptomyces sp. NPDC059909 TaxID=3346998 RepID=UPI00365C3F99